MGTVTIGSEPARGVGQSGSCSTATCQLCWTQVAHAQSNN